MRKLRRISIVIPLFNEQLIIPLLCEELRATINRIPAEAEVILVNDGSQDASVQLIESACNEDARFKTLELSRNFGHQAAITAGIDHAAGDAVVVMDGDLQDPPSAILEMIERWKEGYDVVYGIRTERHGETLFKKCASKVFYRLLNRLSDHAFPNDVGDFRLMDRSVADVLVQLRERGRYLRGLVSWAGFRQTGIYFERGPRAQGTPKYSLKKLVKLAFDGILSFSSSPLRFALKAGFTYALFAILAGSWLVYLKLSGASTGPQGWASTMIFIGFSTGIQLMVMGILGEYMGRVYQETKQRPLYLIRTRIGFDDNTGKARTGSRPLEGGDFALPQQRSPLQLPEPRLPV